MRSSTPASSTTGTARRSQNVPVSLATGPSAPRNDVTDASGAIIFAGLTPNPTSGGQAYYDLSLTPPTGYVTLYDTVSPAAPAHVQLSPGQTWPTALYIYQPATIYVDLKNFDGTPFTGTTTSATVSYTRNSSPYSKAVTYPGSTLTVTSMTEGTQTVQLIPGLSYTVAAAGRELLLQERHHLGELGHRERARLVPERPHAYLHLHERRARDRAGRCAANVGRPHQGLQQRHRDHHRRPVRRRAVELHGHRDDDLHGRTGCDRQRPGRIRLHDHGPLERDRCQRHAVQPERPVRHQHTWAGRPTSGSNTC